MFAHRLDLRAFISAFAHLGNNCIQNFHPGRYIVRYTVRNLGSVSWLNVISDPIFDDIPPYYENFEYCYPHSNTLLQFCFNLNSCKLHKAARHQMKCDVINDIKLSLTVYPRIFCHKFVDIIHSDDSLTKSIALEFPVQHHQFHTVST